MKWEKTIPSLLRDILNRYVLFFVFFSFIINISIYSQEYQYNFINKPLSEILLNASDSLGFSVAFDAQKLKNVRISKRIQANTTEELIANLLKETGFSYQYKHGSYLILEASEQEKNNSPGHCDKYQLKGIVTDGTTGIRLPFATVLIMDQKKYLSASLDGYFVVKDMLSDQVAVRVRYVGYSTLDTTINCKDANTRHNFKLNPQYSMIDGVDVVGKREERLGTGDNINFATTLKPDNLENLPLFAESGVFKSLQLIPGVGQTEDVSELSIRGGTSDQNLVLLDGQTLYNLSHCLGMFSAVNENIVDKLDVYKGGFDSKYGERISGIVDITGKTGNQEKPFVIGELNMYAGDLTVELPIGKKVSIISSGRFSFADMYKYGLNKDMAQSELLSIRDEYFDIVSITEPSVKFYDFYTKANLKINKNNQIAVSLYKSSDQYFSAYTAKNSRVNIHSVDTNRWNNFGVSLTWNKNWNEKFNTKLQTGISGYNNNSDYFTEMSPIHTTLDDDRQDTLIRTDVYNKLNDYFIRTENCYCINENNRLEFGALIRKYDISYQNIENSVSDYYSIQSGILSALFLQEKIEFKDKITVKPGFRMSYFSGTNNFYFEPRFSLHYNMSEHVSWRFSTGQYNQFINQVTYHQNADYPEEVLILSNDSINPVLKSQHFVFGGTVKSGKFVFDAESYIKTLTDVQDYLYNPYHYNETDENSRWPRSPVPVNLSEIQIADENYSGTYISGTGISKGVDVMVKYNENKFITWVSYSLSKSIYQFKEINNGEAIAAPNDKTHQFSWSATYSTAKWNIGTTTSYTTGKSYLTKAEYNGDLNVLRQYKRLPDYFRTDINASYNLNIKKVRIKTGLAVYNIFNKENYYDVNTRIIQYEDTSLYETKFIPSRARSMNFYIRFSF